MKEYESNKKMERCYIFVIIYSLLGILNLFLLSIHKDYDSFITIFDFFLVFYLITFPFVSLYYLVYGCFHYKHKIKLFNIIDCLLCTIEIVALPAFLIPPIFYYIYQYNEHLYYLLGACFSFSPLIYSYYNKEKIKWLHILSIIARIAIICLIVLTLKWGEKSFPFNLLILIEHSFKCII